MSLAETVPAWVDPDDDRTARAAWSRLAEPGDVAAWRAVQALGAGRALLALVERPGALSMQVGAAKAVAGWRVRLPQADPVRDLATVRRFDGTLLVPGDPDWPPRLADLGEREPLALWVRGPLPLASTVNRSVAVVGSRACSGYGEWICSELASGCADRGITVVSGAAYGIDAVAHRAALAVEGATVAVLACGVDRAYPQGNDQLIQRIATHGAVVSEVAPGSSPTRWRFVTRNRVIAALGGATVVVEAGWRSGALITAHEAADLGREVGAVPGPVTSAASAGCHKLLRKGAVCVTDAAEVLELLEPVGGSLAPERSTASAAHDGLSPVELRVLDALPVRRAVELDRLAVTAGVDRASLFAALGRLELRGLATRAGTAWRKAPAKRDAPRPGPAAQLEQLFDEG